MDVGDDLPPWEGASLLTVCTDLRHDWVQSLVLAQVAALDVQGVASIEMNVFSLIGMLGRLPSGTFTKINYGTFSAII